MSTDSPSSAAAVDEAQASQAPAAPVAEQPTRFFPAAIDSLDDADLMMDVYLKHKGDGPPTLYRAKGVAFAEQDRERLIKKGVRFVYIPESQHGEFRKALTKRLDNLYGDDSIKERERARMIRTSCGQLIEDVLASPASAAALSCIGGLSEQFAQWIGQDPTRFSSLLDMSEHDFYTATHMLNVSIGCGLLAAELRPNDKDLITRIIEGGMLHDIGKRGIPEGVLNKEGKLDPDEWAMIQKHPLEGHRELKTMPAVSPVVLEMTRDHHERLDGKGYPRGLKNEQIGFAARICAVVDVFDAITAARPYRGPNPPQDVLKLMASGAGLHFDPDILAAWTRIIERSLEVDPSRAPAPNPDKEFGCLASAIQTDKAPEEDVLTIVQNVGARDEDGRREHQRFAAALNVEAEFIRQGKDCPVKPGEPFDCRTVDVSQGGLQLNTQWPLSQGDVLRLRMKQKGDRVIERFAMVVRVRGGSGDSWLSGLKFIEKPETKHKAA
ncbi:MAG: HD domain-containing protein [Phycisphaeraceae bacterium]|nr:MAG: HD domain-containing protein [Phycisphaeraceae bacterium]